MAFNSLPKNQAQTTNVFDPISTQESNPNVRYFWVAMNDYYSADALARSWREKRISPDDLFEANNKRLTFRQLCQFDSRLHKELGVLPAEPSVPKKRSWFAELRFRYEAWRKVVENGELVPVKLAKRIDCLSGELETTKQSLLDTQSSLQASHLRVDQLVRALRTGIEDADELVAICKVCEDARTDGMGVDALGRNQAHVLGKLASILRQNFADCADGGMEEFSKPDVKRIEQIGLFHREAMAQIEKERRDLEKEKRKWLKLSALHEKWIEKERRDLGREKRKWLKLAALHAKWRDEVKQSLLKNPIMESRFVIGDCKNQRSDWISCALLSYSDTVSPDAVLGIFNGGDGARLGILVAWDGLHWKLEQDATPGFLAWGWEGRILVKKRWSSANIYLENGFTLGMVRGLGRARKIEQFLDRIQVTNESLPKPTMKNDVVSFQAIRSIEDIEPR